MTYDRIARALGVSPARVQQIEHAAMKKCRRACRAFGVTFDDLVLDERPGDAILLEQIEPGAVGDLASSRGLAEPFRADVQTSANSPSTEAPAASSPGDRR